MTRSSTSSVPARQVFVRRNDAAGGDAERGSSLILALVFLVAISLIVLALSAWVSNDLKLSPKIVASEALKSAASDAANLAIQAQRYKFNDSGQVTPNVVGPVACWGSGTSSFTYNQGGVNSTTVNAWCTTIFEPSASYPVPTRTLVVSVCQSPGSGAAACVTNPFLEAVAGYNDYPKNYAVGLINNACQSTCGSGVAVSGWQFSPSPPQFSSGTQFSPTSGPISGGTTVTINGTGFVAGKTTVLFILQNDRATYMIPKGTSVSVSSSTQLTVKTPAQVTPGTYNIMLETPGGYSPLSTATFTFS